MTDSMPDYLLRFDEKAYVMSKRCPFRPEDVPESKINSEGHCEFIRHDGIIFYFHGVKYDSKSVNHRLLTAVLQGQNVVAQDKSLESLISKANIRAEEVLKKRAEKAPEKAE
jgi:hypothetical protein